MGTTNRLPWSNVLSTLLRKEGESSYDNHIIVSFHPGDYDSKRAGQRAVARLLPPVDKTH